MIKLGEKAVSKKQQRFFGLVKSVQDGDTPKSKVTKNVKQVADKMTEKDVDDYASTKTKGLPEEAPKESCIKLAKLVEEDGKKLLFDLEEEEVLTDDMKRQFIEKIKQFNQLSKLVYRDKNLKELTDTVKQIANIGAKIVNSSSDDWFDNVSIQRDMKSLMESIKLFEKTAKELSILQQRFESTFEDIGHKLNRYFDINESI